MKGPGNWKNRKQKLLTESKSVNSRYFAWRREKSKEKKKKKQQLQGPIQSVRRKSVFC